MAAPFGFTWVEKPHLAAMSQPDTAEHYQWLRSQGLQLVISLCEDPPPRNWVNEAGLFAMHIPVEDMHPPSQKQIDLCVSAIAKAQDKEMGAAIHCGAGLGRTGTMLACWFVRQGMSGPAAIAHVRKLRPGSVETPEQIDAVNEYSRRIKRADESGEQ